MKVRTLTIGLSAPLAMVLAWGCAPPEQIVFATPPGVEAPKPELSEAERAEAVGEQAKADSTPKKSRGESTLIQVSNPPTAPGEKKATENGLVYETLKPGTGEMVKTGQKVRVLYTGRFASNGEVFDSTSKHNNEPFPLTLGATEVIRGWHEGIPGMKVGETRQLTIPPHLAYGPQGRGTQIPPNSTLIFDIELLDAQ